MINIKQFTFNPFQENTYVLYDQTKSCIIIDPGCSNKSEEEELVAFISDNKLEPKRLLNTHCHIDHVLGNAFVAKKYSLGLEIHKKDQSILDAVVDYGKMFGINVMPSPKVENYLEENTILTFGDSNLDIIFVPGHAPGHVAFVSKEQKFAIAGDVLFKGSIGRTDLPGGDYDTLINSIKNKILPLGNDFTIHSGHGPSTTVLDEKENNPFLN